MSLGLPQIMQDAIRVAGDLGFEYLWVDALCIVQDDDEEKASEMARMSEVYEGATLTISASRAAHCDGGLLHRRDLRAHYVELYELPWGDGERSLGTGTVLCSEIGYFRCESDPIDLRAWTLQEHRLSRRLLRFGSNQLVWRCMASTQVDGGPGELSPSSSAVSIFPKHTRPGAESRDTTAQTICLRTHRLFCHLASSAMLGPETAAKVCVLSNSMRCGPTPSTLTELAAGSSAAR